MPQDPSVPADVTLVYGVAAFSTFIQGEKEIRDLIQYLITLFIHSRLQFPLAQIAASYVPVSSKSNQSGLGNCP